MNIGVMIQDDLISQATKRIYLKPKKNMLIQIKKSLPNFIAYLWQKVMLFLLGADWIFDIQYIFT